MVVERVSTYFHLCVEQGGLDFVDVDVVGDVPVYIDPTAIRVHSGDWVEACRELLTSFFEQVLLAIKEDDDKRLKELFYPLSEPNETHLGLSKGKSRGRSLGSKAKANELIAALRRSRAAKSGLLEDLEDTALFVDGIGRDILSDITTCIIRSQLITYTQNQCEFHSIPTQQQHSGMCWSAESLSWEEEFVELPRGPEGTLLLIPKGIVRLTPSFDSGEYYRGYLRPYFEDEELNKGISSEFVRLVGAKTKRPRYKIDTGALDRSLGTTKSAVAKNSEAHPGAMGEYREKKRESASRPMSAQELALATGTPPPDLRELLESVRAIKPGQAGANSYHRAIAAFFNALFAGSLGVGKIEEKLHGGLKRIDIVYDNLAGDGFFHWLGRYYSAPIVVVECKNYGKDVGNPELDQIAMRFSPKRGEFGILTCRELQDRDKALVRAKNAADDNHGYVIVLEDADLETLVDEVENAQGEEASTSRQMKYLRERFNELLGIG